MTQRSRESSTDRRTAISDVADLLAASDAPATIAASGLRARIYEPDFQHATINPTWRQEHKEAEPSQPASADFEPIQRTSDAVRDRASDHLECDQVDDDCYSTLLATEEPVSR